MFKTIEKIRQRANREDSNYDYWNQIQCIADRDALLKYIDLLHKETDFMRSIIKDHIPNEINTQNRTNP